jgi:hypothetical protein
MAGLSQPARDGDGARNRGEWRISDVEKEKAFFESQFAKMQSLVDKAPDWSELAILASEVASRARKPDTAIDLVNRAVALLQRDTRADRDPDLRTRGLQSISAASGSPTSERTRQLIDAFLSTVGTTTTPPR